MRWFKRRPKPKPEFRCIFCGKRLGPANIKAYVYGNGPFCNPCGLASAAKHHETFEEEASKIRTAMTSVSARATS